MNNLVSLCRIAKSDRSTTSPTVLIVDPQVDMDSPLASEFRERGVVVFIAHDQAAALDIGASVHPVFAIVEVQLRNGCGFEVIKALATGQPSCKVFVSTDYCDLKVTVCAVKFGALDVFPKSMPVALLVGLVLGDELEALVAKGCLARPEQIRRDHIVGVYAAYDHNVSRAARRLSMHRRSLQRYLDQHGVN
ncbi:response regulator transcription factor [Rhizobium leguminosarum]|uniref:response regulator transcription factor n=1 Tax=Rhizobium leguminosarum TaxID=384 RepID=UPI00103133AB|nr:response regulator [Rhizobium leguminosarum]QIO76241.1 response regulator [Rhizobium leguminosarum bv. trifolii]QIO83260.1 response regulator [Rhizobium leguminosarum bv. trifolii]TAU16487.1 response regulator [Rhizobium leguminosarum]TAU34818.1 response regulator [Rhizobium leguminosarum]TAX44004.1 response regulator [Rhizobium leguminosarum]